MVALVVANQWVPLVKPKLFKHTVGSVTITGSAPIQRSKECIMTPTHTGAGRAQLSGFPASGDLAKGPDYSSEFAHAENDSNHSWKA